MLEMIYFIFIVGLLWFLYIYQKDVFEPEPSSKIFKAVAWGAIPAVLISTLLENFDFLWVGLLTAPILEEAVKGYYIYRIRNNPELEGPMDGLVYGAAVGMGFEIVENLLYSVSSEISLEIAVLRSISVGHILFTGFFGLMVGLAKIKGKGLFIVYGYIGAVLMHLVWNIFATENRLSYFILVPIFILTLKKIADAAWKYELEIYLSPQDEMEEKARRFITEHDGASTANLAEELGIAPHRTALFKKTIGARFDQGQKKWFVTAVKQG